MSTKPEALGALKAGEFSNRSRATREGHAARLPPPAAQPVSHGESCGIQDWLILAKSSWISFFGDELKQIGRPADNSAANHNVNMPRVAYVIQWVRVEQH